MTISATLLAWGAATDRGLRRATNEDAYIAEPPLFLVADGMGGHEAGADASHAALEGFRALVGRESLRADDVEAAFRAAVTAVDALPAHVSRPGTTLAGAAVCEQDGAAYWLVINVGDSRTYRLADGVLEQVSIDHSAVQALVDRGAITAGQAARHPQRNIVTRALGGGSAGVPDYWMLPVTAGDRMLVCSDGLCKEVVDADIHRALTAEPSPQAAATRLVHEALLHGGRDNVTVVVVDVQSLPEPDDEPTLPTPGGGLAVALPVGAREEEDDHAHL